MNIAKYGALNTDKHNINKTFGTSLLSIPESELYSARKMLCCSDRLKLNKEVKNTHASNFQGQMAGISDPNIDSLKYNQGPSHLFPYIFNTEATNNLLSSDSSCPPQRDGQ